MSSNEQLTPGMELGRCELLVPIAQGGMATVWAARQKGSRGFQKTVAIKTMLPNLSDDAQFEQMFLDEARLASRIHHPNVVEILDLGEQQDILYIVMEWIDGEALSVLGRAGKKAETPMPVRVVLKIISQASAGLHAAHELKDENEQLLHIVHRDVSPQNILVTFDGLVKLVDFGVAKAVGRASGETTAGQIKGKIPYMSPEQARGGDVDRRTDIFAMGIVLYRMLTGVHPFSGENDLVTMKNIISRPVLPPRVKNSALPRELDQIVVKCLQKEPEKRFQTMAELQGALEQVVSTMGGAGSVDEVGAYVRLLVGERGQKRRAAIRDASRALDERSSTVSVPKPAVSQPVVHEAVSEIMLTAMKSGVTQEALPAAVVRSSDLPSSATPSNTEVPIVPERRGRTGVIAAAIVFAALAIGVGVFFGLKSREEGSARAGEREDKRGAGAPAPATQTPTGTAAPAPSETAPPAATQSAAAAVDLDAIPSDTKSAKPGRKSGPAGPAPTAAASVPRIRSSAWVPTVQDPGF